MHWLDRAYLNPDNSVTAQRLITPDHPFLENNQLLPCALIELLAQAAAAGVILASRSSAKKLKSGVLAAIQEFQILAPVHIHDLLTLTACQEKSFGPFSAATLRASLQNRAIATARMTFHLQFE